MATRTTAMLAAVLLGLGGCVSSASQASARPTASTKSAAARPTSAVLAKAHARHSPRPRKADQMDLEYVKSGGFAGMMDRVVIHDGHLEVERRKQVLVDRPLTSEEQTEIDRLVEAAEKTKPTFPPENHHLRDGFTFTLSLPGEPTPELRVYGSGLPHGLGDAWDALFEKLHAIFEQAARAPQPAH